MERLSAARRGLRDLPLTAAAVDDGKSWNKRSKQRLVPGQQSNKDARNARNNITADTRRRCDNEGGEGGGGGGGGEKREMTMDEDDEGDGRRGAAARPRRTEIEG